MLSFWVFLETNIWAKAYYIWKIGVNGPTIVETGSSKLLRHFIEYHLDQVNNMHTKIAANLRIQSFESWYQKKYLIKDCRRIFLACLLHSGGPVKICQIKRKSICRNFHLFLFSKFEMTIVKNLMEKRHPFFIMDFEGFYEVLLRHKYFWSTHFRQ